MPTWGTPSGGFGLLFGLIFMIPGLVAMTLGWSIWRPWHRPNLEE
jgi:hypothetical protein